MDTPHEADAGAERPATTPAAPVAATPAEPDRTESADAADRPAREPAGDPGSPPAEAVASNGATEHPQSRRDQGFNRHDRSGRRHRRNRGRSRGRDPREGNARGESHEPANGGNQGPVVLTPAGDVTGWFDPQRDSGFLRRAESSYLTEAGDAYVPPQMVRQLGLRKSDRVDCAVGRDHRGRLTVMEVRSINGEDPATSLKRPDFQSLTASYPERKLFLETGRPAKGGPELTRRAIDLIAPIGFGQRALIVAPARAGKTTLLRDITEGVVINHPKAVLLILLVDERPEEVSEAISWGVGEVIASSFDQPAQRHVDVTEMVLEHARRQVELGRDVVIVLDSLTRMARAHNTAERGTGRTLSGGLDATAMAKPKAFFGSARNVLDTVGGGSLTIIATALVETGSRMDDVIFEEFKGTGNCEIKLDRSLAEKRIYPAIDIATSGTRREEKLFRAEQMDSVFTLRRGLAQMPPQAAMEWLIKRIAATPNNDALLEGL
ncbi:MAG TPA: transcription termination factor Rho [Gemmatimonadaceae bacterium]|nr:transcription termination factor Rho [Gemmatimonadaceae bacterium]